ncbi:hypothetical protein M422DRAFT_183942 [Sphaerobolus stellatus SS14]|uniref:CxC2-like cysteine cluster KDZ transposase-associated domain-containing protein n=1 Tax=Sphaerobolus stellatus (strain SS14) TaxID=990650 RepID=A0A0C9TRX7_SPHS4|nr:hypothetical protein M422DRAFT_183942 [Sphaerobolus stellatus SS14]
MERVKLIDLDFTWHVSHEGQPCPYFADRGGSQNITLVDTTGIHYVNVGFCRCGNAGNFAEQLMLVKLFPATVDQPKTAFTFRCLKLFHMLNLIAHTTAWDFTGMLQRLTDNVDPHGNPGIYKQFNFVQRQWRLVWAWRRAGRTGLNGGEHLPMALPCVSCPLPGINLDRDWQSDPERYVS